MDSATCNVIYVDRNVRCDTQLVNSSTEEDIGTALGDSGELRTNVQLILYAFGNGMSHLNISLGVEKKIQLLT